MMTCWKTIWLASVLCAAVLLGGVGISRGDSTDAGATPATFSVKVTGAGRPMILIPGLSCGGEVWDATVAHFKDRYECHVLTLAGFAGQPAVGGPFLEKVRADIAKYIDDQKLDHPVIIGHSLGGFMAFWLGATIPGKVGPIIAVDGLPFLPALFNPAATAESSRTFAEMYRSQYASQTTADFMAANRKALASMITDPKDVDFVNATSKNSDSKAVGQAFYDLMTTDLRPLGKAIQAPYLLIGATASLPDAQRSVVQAAYRAQVASVPNHKVVFAPKGHHFVQLDAPEFFYDQVETFLKEQGARSNGGA